MSKSSSFIWPENVSFNSEAENDFANLDNSQRIVVSKAIVKVAANPKPRPNGYGKPLSGSLSGCCKIKLRDFGIRIIYRLVPPDFDNMEIIIIGLRVDDEVYKDAEKRLDNVLN